MPASNKTLTGCPTLTVAKATNGAATATVTAPTDPNFQLFCYGFWYSLSAAPTASLPLEFTVTGLVGGTITLELPASASAPVAFFFGTHPLRAAVTTNIVASLPALGSGIVGTVGLLTEVDQAP